mmetsp:Transcript_111005/g.318986  ORF Transcript_111005/g.318986 Transcript_111005/m.318986 type:complete len:476 (+) Transcript_111005:380-1807(+)
MVPSKRQPGQPQIMQPPAHELEVVLPKFLPPAEHEDGAPEGRHGGGPQAAGVPSNDFLAEALDSRWDGVGQRPPARGLRDVQRLLVMRRRWRPRRDKNRRRDGHCDRRSWQERESHGGNALGRALRQILARGRGSLTSFALAIGRCLGSGRGLGSASREGDPMSAEHIVELPPQVGIEIEPKDVFHNFGNRVLREVLQMSHDIDDLARRVWVRDQAFVGHVPKLREGCREALHECRRHIRAVAPQQRDLRGQVGVADGMHSENVAHLPEKVVAEEGESRAVRQGDHPEVRVDRGDQAALLRRERLRVEAVLPSVHETPPIGELHLAVLEEALQHADDLGWCLVELVHDQDPSALEGADKGRIFVLEHATFERRQQCQRLHSRVAVQLHILPLEPEELQKPVGELVLTHTLVADEQQVLPEHICPKHRLQQPGVHRHIEEDDVRHQGSMLRPAKRASGLADVKEPRLLVDMDLHAN